MAFAPAGRLPGPEGFPGNHCRGLRFYNAQSTRHFPVMQYVAPKGVPRTPPVSHFGFCPRRAARLGTIRSFKPAYRLQMAVLPQGSTNPLLVTGRPISLEETFPGCLRFTVTPSRYSITEGESPVV